ncbi:MAG: IMP dehydrogenase [Candidatus Midichloriaceae bacterium]|jgi:IMP dehydrogenase
MQKIKEQYSFEDVLISPRYSDVLPKEADVSTNFTKKIKLNLPIISAAMDTVTEYLMAKQMAILGGIGVIHKNMSVDSQSKEILKIKEYKVDIVNEPFSCLDENNRLRVAAAIGASNDDIERAKSLIDSGVDAIVIDTSHGHSKNVIDTIKNLKSFWKTGQIIAGNVATKEAALDLIYAGADAIKVGIGPGSICTTRIITGVGIPQLSAIMEISDVCKTNDVFLIADGGIKYSGDIAKAIGAGADTVMLGSLLAGTDVSPGEILTIEGEKYKSYRGMGSLNAMRSGSADRYFQNNNANLVPQGVEGYLKYKGSINDIIHQLKGGLTSAMGYTGSKNIEEMKKNCTFVKITAAGMKESHIHSLDKSEDTINYKKS